VQRLIIISFSDRDLDRRTYQSAVLRLEREKNALLREKEIMQACHANDLITTRLQAQMTSTDGFRERYNFYRAYYHDQQNLNSRYLALSNRDDHDDEEPEILEAQRVRIIQVGNGEGSSDSGN
jgi:hypothetical protein